MEKPNGENKSGLEDTLNRTSYDNGFESCKIGPENILSCFDSERLEPDFRTNAFIRGVDDAVSMGESPIRDIIDFDSALLQYYPLPGPFGDVYAKRDDTFMRNGAEYQIVKCIKADSELVYVFARERDSGEDHPLVFEGKEAAELLLKSHSK